MSDRPFRVGLTGTVAAGKSAVGRMFETWGAVRIDSDDLAREAVRPGSKAFAQIRDTWGDDVLSSDGTLDRAALRRRIFDDDGERERLEGFVHAAIRELRAERLAEAAGADTRIVVEEIPLLFEVGLASDYDSIIVVDADGASRAARAHDTRGWTAEEFEQVDASQLPAAEKRRRADHVIDNDGDLAALERAAQSVWSTIVSAAAARRVARPVDGSKRAR